ncbi:hypothetical protein LSTR_LSTR003098 [Laodelphax striatellus]|uniref:Uncharacterized protein n=1 Tax=Laodelphax striatellus TaxID=195883 RepID=A0A482WVR5_LAOST|nr:hypothetical protein LSTR_LSTR003098 [Laodelphax striatellus]
MSRSEEGGKEREIGVRRPMNKKRKEEGKDGEVRKKTRVKFFSAEEDSCRRPSVCVVDILSRGGTGWSGGIPLSDLGTLLSTYDFRIVFSAVCENKRSVSWPSWFGLYRCDSAQRRCVLWLYICVFSLLFETPRLKDTQPS